MFALGYCAATCIAATRAWICQLAQLESEVGFQPKVKILLGFYQISSTLSGVYGVHEYPVGAGPGSSP